MVEKNEEHRKNLKFTNVTKSYKCIIPKIIKIKKDSTFMLFQKKLQKKQFFIF